VQPRSGTPLDRDKDVTPRHAPGALGVAGTQTDGRRPGDSVLAVLGGRGSAQTMKPPKLEKRPDPPDLARIVAGEPIGSALQTTLRRDFREFLQQFARRPHRGDQAKIA